MAELAVAPRVKVWDGHLDMNIDRNPGVMVAWYLMASYLYYHLDHSLLSDARYDRLCKELDERWDEVDHWHKYAVERDALKSGTAMLPVEGYPPRSCDAALHLAGIKAPKLHSLTDHKQFWIKRGKEAKDPQVMRQPAAPPKEPAPKKKKILRFGKKAQCN